MKIFFIISEDRFLKPKFLQRIIRKRRKDIIGIAIISGRNPGVSFFQYLKRHLLLFGPIVFFVLSLKEIYYSFLDKISLFSLLKRLYSTKEVARKYKIPIYLPKNINNPDFVEKLSKLKPDIIVSSCAQIFKKDLLKIPRIACINRHTALLPEYGGMWPVFWAMLNDEKNIGVTIHEMSERIDEGRIITQGIIDREKEDSMYEIYGKGMELSADLVLEALDIIEHKKKYKLINKNRNRSYYKFPTKKEVTLFRKKGYKFI